MLLLPRTLTAYIALALLPCILAQSAGTTAPLVYTYDPAESAPSSLLNAISTAGAPARSIDASSAGADTATGLVSAYPTTSTVGSVTPPDMTSAIQFSSAASGEIFSTATRAPYIASGTIDTSMASGVVGAATSTAVSAGVKVAELPTMGLAVGCAVTLMGMVAGVGFFW